MPLKAVGLWADDAERQRVLEMVGAIIPENEHWDVSLAVGNEPTATFAQPSKGQRTLRFVERPASQLGHRYLLHKAGTETIHACNSIQQMVELQFILRMGGRELFDALAAAAKRRGLGKMKRP